ncbi:MAG: HAMP domain-containing histidine kinase [Coriobacteriales bacterium]|nr:HAMP domain-containing histidine kinase [Coriobacteriales bacterium]
MHRSSLRTWLLLVSILFAALVVGGVSVTTYVIVTDGIRGIAVRRATSIASEAGRIATGQSEFNRIFSPTDDTKPPDERFVEELPRTLAAAEIAGAQFALYNADLEPLWSSTPGAVVEATDNGRLAALQNKRRVRSDLAGGGVIQGLFTSADLGTVVVHSPVTFPSGAQGVLDLVFHPIEEETVINSIRIPMAMLAIASAIVMVLLMQTSMAWVLKLVDDLREAADSIDAGRLSDRLPVEGDNEVGALAGSVNRLIERLQRRHDAQTRFVGDASHELATPVAGIRGYTSILREWGADDPQVRQEAIDAIDRESRRMARLTGDLLNLLHTDQGLVFKSVRFDLNALVRDRLAATASRWLDKDLEYVGPGESPLIMFSDPDRVEDVISILLDNAAKYTPSGGKVTVETRRRRDVIVVEVSDTGQGIPSHDLPHIFDRFYRSEASRTSSEAGFGLGLAIAHNIVESAGGQIGVDSVEGEGTTFTVQMPRGRL